MDEARGTGFCEHEAEGASASATDNDPRQDQSPEGQTPPPPLAQPGTEKEAADDSTAIRDATDLIEVEASEGEENNDEEDTMAPPKDRYWLAWGIFCMLGMGCLLPWNFFISVSDYWMYKFRNVSDPTSGTSNTTAAVLTPLQIKWNSYLSIASMIPNVTVLLLNAVFGHKFPTHPRLFVAMAVLVVVFIYTDVTAAIDTDGFQYAFLYSTLASVVVINIVVAIFQGGLFGLAAKFPPAYMNAVLQGQAIGGIFASATNVLIIMVGDSPQDSAFWCFLITIMFMVLSGVSLLVLTLTKFFRYYDLGPSYVVDSGDSEDDVLVDEEEEAVVEEDENQNQSSVSATSGPKAEAAGLGEVIRVARSVLIWIVAVFINFVVTLAVFPAIGSLVKSVDAGNGNAWNDVYFTPVCCFLVFNIGDYLGRISAGWAAFPNEKTRAGGLITLALTILRAAFIPFFIFCNASPMNRRVTEVLVKSDPAFVIGVALFAWTGGYIGSVVMMFGPKHLPDGQSQSIAASVLVSFLVLGLAFGAALSSVCVMLL